MSKPWTGASVMLFELWKDQPTVILFRDVQSNTYSEAGGDKEGSESAERCAQRELKQESLGVFRIDLVQTKWAIRVRKTYRDKHICFCMYITGPKGAPIHRSYYEFNRNLLRTFRDVPSSWRETNRMTRVSLSTIRDAMRTQEVKPGTQLMVTDVYNKPCTIHHRTVSLLKQIVITAGETKTWIPVPLKDNGACKHGLGEPGTQLRWNTNNGRAKCYYY